MIWETRKPCVATIYLPWTLALTLAMQACSPASDTNRPARDLTVFAASSLASVMPGVGRLFEVHNPGSEVKFSFAASSVLAKQVAAGARADIYISANPDWVDFLQARHLIRPGSRRTVLRNRLVLVAPASQPFGVRSLKDLSLRHIRRVALADWSHVPAGIYAKQALEVADIWDQVASKCLPALDVRAALAYVERGDADCGIVYRTDAAISQQVRVVFELPHELQPKIEYAAAILSVSESADSDIFMNFLSESAAVQVFEDAGFDMFTVE